MSTPVSPLSTPDSSDLQKTYLDQIARRLKQGGEDYGDKSLTKPTPETVGEILEEAIDIPGWFFPLWVELRRRLQGLTIAADAAELELEQAADCPVCQAKAGQVCRTMSGVELARSHHPRSRG